MSVNTFIIVLLLYLLYKSISKKEKFSVPGDNYILDDGASGELGLHNAMCSKLCCNQQYPVPFKLKYDETCGDDNDNYVSSNIQCSNSFQDVGCLCLTNSQFDNLTDRGGNAR